MFNITNTNKKIIINELTEENLKIHTCFEKYKTWLKKRENNILIEYDICIEEIENEKILWLLNKEIKQSSKLKKKCRGSTIIINNIKILTSNNEKIEIQKQNYLYQCYLNKLKKTKLMIELVGLINANVKGKTLILTNKSLLQKWEECIYNCLNHNSFVYDYLYEDYEGNDEHDTKSYNEYEKKVLDNSKIIIMSYDNYVLKMKNIKMYYWNRIIFDEAEFIKNKRNIFNKYCESISSEIKWFTIN